MFLNVRVSYVARTVVLLVLLATICVSLVQADGTYPNITVIAVSPLGTDRYLLYGSDRGNVSVIDLQRLWDPFASVLVQEFKIEAFSKIRDLKFSPDGKIVAVAGFSPSQHDSKRFPYHTCGSVKELAGVALLDVAKGFEVIDTPIDDSISIDFLDNQRLVVLTPTELLIWNLNTRNVEKAQKINRGRVAVVDPETKDIWVAKCNGEITSRRSNLMITSRWQADPATESMYVLMDHLITVGKHEVFVWRRDKRTNQWRITKKWRLGKDAISLVPSDERNLYIEERSFLDQLTLRSVSTNETTSTIYYPARCVGDEGVRPSPAIVLEREGYLVTSREVGCDNDGGSYLNFFDKRLGLPLFRSGDMGKIGYFGSGPGGRLHRECRPSQGVEPLTKCIARLSQCNTLPAQLEAVAFAKQIEFNNQHFATNRSALYAGLIMAMPKDKGEILRLARYLAVNVEQVPSFPPDASEQSFLDKVKPDASEPTLKRLAEVRRLISEIRSVELTEEKDEDYKALVEALRTAKQELLLTLQLHEYVLDFTINKERATEIERALLTLAAKRTNDYRPNYILIWLYGELQQWEKQQQAVISFNQRFQFKTLSVDPAFGCSETFIEDTITNYTLNPLVDRKIP